ncbi:MAG: GNAT family N-acetyltransferase [bacterium]
MPALQVIEAIATPPRPRARPNSQGPADRGASAVARERARRVRLVSADEPALMALLRTSPIDVAYMLGDLDVPYAEHCRWYAVDDGRLGGVLLHYNGLSMPTVLTHGSAVDVEALLLATNTDLPRRFYGHFHPEHRAAFEAFFDLGTPRPMKRMGLARAAYHRQGDFAEVEPLTHRDTGAIMRLYQHYPDNFFEPAQLDTGLYFGIRDGDDLISVAGIHVLSERHDIAAIGNIVTHSGHRGRGLATRCVGRLLDALFQKVGAVALNVQEGNEPAIRCYRKFGFADRYDFWEGVAQAR